MPQPFLHRTLVTGDIVIDHHVYSGERAKPTTGDRRGVRLVSRHGGAAGLHRLVSNILLRLGSSPQDVADWLELGLALPPIESTPNGRDAYAIWRPFPQNRVTPHGPTVWRAHELMGYGGGECDAAPASVPHAIELHSSTLPVALVIDDAGYQFRLPRCRNAWASAQAANWILLKHAAPVAHGDLWHELASSVSDRLVCLVAAHDLREENAAISQGLSWERTVDSLAYALQTSPVLSQLAACRHLIVTFAADAALWLERCESVGPQARLIYDPTGSEGEYAARSDGEVIGSMTVMAASLAACLAASAPGHTPDFAGSITVGLAAMRRLKDLGHGDVGPILPCGFPDAQIAEALTTPTNAFATASVPWRRNAPDARPWAIVESSQNPSGRPSRPESLVGLAQQVAITGTAALQHLPHARFGSLITADRMEIESLRNLRRLLRTYQADTTVTKPFSVGVFGPPGAGKSFGVKQIALEVFGADAWLEFNLSQFSGADDLLGAFHQVRDRVLSGVTPVVFWDEFDSNEYGWLQYLLAPMQDGRFQQGQLTHAIGRGVFVFAGGTSHDYQSFGPSVDATLEAKSRYRMRKGPDFHSRLDIFYNVLGPNPRQDAQSGPTESADLSYPIRRALLIRQFLAGRSEARLEIDPDLLNALLLVPRYTHGARSLEKLVRPLRGEDGTIRRSALPPPSQLAMHVDAKAFHRLLDRNAAFRQAGAIDALAAAVHQRWLASPDAERAIKPHLDRPYDQLSDVDKETNRAAARRIPEVLAVAGLGLQSGVETSATHAAEIADHIRHHLERLAEAEHLGWMQHRLRSGWRYSEVRDDPARLHPALVPYLILPEVNKEKDRSQVLSYAEKVTEAGYRIDWLASEDKGDANAQ